MRYVKHILCIFLFVLMFGSVSLAASGYTDQEIGDKIVDLLEETYNMTDFVNGNYAYLGTQLNTSNNSETYSLVTWKSGNWTTAAVGVLTNVTDTSVTFNGTFYFVSRRNSDYNATSNESGSAQGVSNIVVFGLMSSWMVSVDWDNPIYDPMIFSPNYNITTNIHNAQKTVDLSYTRMSDDNYFNEVYNNRTYYLYLKYYLYSGKDIYVDYNHYTCNSYYKSDPIVVYDYQDMRESSGFWTIDLNDYKGDAVDDFLQYVKDHVTLNFVSGMSAGTQLQRDLDYINCIDSGFPYFVNNVEIWAQVFYVEDGKVYVSSWTKWNSPRLNQYAGVTPVADDVPARGIKNTESPYSEIAQNPENDTYNPIGEQTGTDQQNGTQVVINNNTPNYPDYPTAVSYNHDNVLLQFIQTAAYIPQMFAGYSSFLTSAFAFIPSGIWTIIGMGFLSSIVIMIVKVL